MRVDAPVPVRVFPRFCNRRVPGGGGDGLKCAEPAKKMRPEWLGIRAPID
jgi:hypothetical protein